MGRVRRSINTLHGRVVDAGDSNATMCRRSRCVLFVPGASGHEIRRTNCLKGWDILR